MTNEIESDPFDLIDSYDFDLPKSLIAQNPLPNREDARLMVVNRQDYQIEHWHVRDLTELLRPGDCLVLNDTRVIPAKLVGKRLRTGGRWQGLVTETDAHGNWKMLAKTRGKIQVGESVELEDREGKPRVKLELAARLDDGFWVGRPVADPKYGDASGTRSPEEWLQLVGRIPLPHYIRGGNMVDSDIQDYQTVYASKSGAIAAPTAGLHFTKSLCERLQRRGVEFASVTLHVGIGTFRPVATERLSDHQMHSEFGEIDQANVDKINTARANGGRVIAVGTTSVRVLETAGSEGELVAWRGATDLFIRPGFPFRVIDGLMTNFHLPRSTLLVLVRTFGGADLMKRAYHEAVDEEYRFFSYGDAMLII